MNILEERGLKALIKETIQEELEELKERIEMLEAGQNIEEETEEQDEEEPEEENNFEDEEIETPPKDNRNPEYVKAMRQAERENWEGEISQEQMKKLQHTSTKEHMENMVKKHVEKNKRERFDAGFDDEPQQEENEEDDDDLSEYEDSD